MKTALIALLFTGCLENTTITISDNNGTIATIATEVKDTIPQVTYDLDIWEYVTNDSMTTTKRIDAFDYDENMTLTASYIHLFQYHSASYDRRVTLESSLEAIKGSWNLSDNNQSIDWIEDEYTDNVIIYSYKRYVDFNDSLNENCVVKDRYNDLLYRSSFGWHGIQIDCDYADSNSSQYFTKAKGLVNQLFFDKTDKTYYHLKRWR